MSVYQRLRQMPFARILFIYIICILLAENLLVHISVLLFKLTFVACLGLVIVQLLLLKSGKKLSAKYTSVLILTFVLFFYACIQNQPAVISNTKQKIRGVVSCEPKINENSTSFVVRIIQADYQKTLFSGSVKALIYTQKNTPVSEKIQAGYMVEFYNNLSEIKNNGNPGEFNYKRYQQNHGVYYSTFLSADEIKLFKPSGKFFFLNLISIIRNKVSQSLEKFAFDEDAEAIISALVLGDRNYLSDDIEQSYIHAGAIHILAISGLHVGILYIIFLHMLFLLNKSRQLKILQTIIVITIIWFYALIAGFSPSVLRASIMFSLIQVGKTFRRDISVYNIISVSAFLMLLGNARLIHDVGFQLSFLAVTGIIYFQPKLFGLFHIQNRFLRLIYKLFTVGVAAQISTFPLTVFYFNQFPTYFWLTNIFIVPAIFVILIIILLYFAFSSIGIGVNCIGSLLNFCISQNNYVISSIDSLPHSILSPIYLSEIEVVILYSFIIAVCFWVYSKKPGFLIQTQISILLLVGINLYFSIFSQPNEVVIFNSYRLEAMGIARGKQKLLLTSSTATENGKNLKYIFDMFNKEYRCKNTEVFGFERFVSVFAEKKSDCLKLYLNNSESIVLYNKNFSGKEPAANFYCTCLWVVENLSVPNYKLNTGKIIIGGSLGTTSRRKWIEYAGKWDIDYADIKNDGAFVLKL